MAWRIGVRPRDVVVGLCGASAALMLALAMGLRFGATEVDRTSLVSGPHRLNGQRGWTLAVTIDFDSAYSLQSMLAAVQPLCEYVARHESSTLSYEVMVSDKPGVHRCLVFERYSDKDHAYLAVHRASREFQTFREFLRGMQHAGTATVHGDSFNESGLGFV